MGPGLLFQLDPEADPVTATACYYCHAPLSRQAEMIEKGRGEGRAFTRNKAFYPALKATGVSCAVCHVRSGQVIGPPSPVLEGLANGVKASHLTRQQGFFTEAGFCAACHQLREGFRLNGRLLVNTFAEWKESPAARAGITCQVCHMPGRRHLFRGIHDPAMARQGISVETRKIRDKGGTVLRLTISNTGTGHFFPTYATPLIMVRGFLADKAGRAVKGTEKRAYIGRKLALDLSKEFFDTRIAPLGTFVFDYPLERTGGAAMAVFEATVYPDEFYRRFYESFLRQDMKMEKRALARRALQRSRASAYRLFRKEVLLSSSPRR